MVHSILLLLQKITHNGDKHLHTQINDEISDTFWSHITLIHWCYVIHQRTRPQAPGAGWLVGV